MPPAPPLVALRDAAITFGGKPLFSDITLTLGKGERVALVGANGSGKSTILKALAGQIDLDAGTRFLQPGTRIGYLSQSPDLSKGGSVAAFVSAALPGADTDDYRIARVLDHLDLDPARDTATLSGGEGRRAAMARALKIELPDKQLLFLPLSHVFAKVLQVAFIRLGVPTAICADADHLLEAMQETNPTWMGTVPRIFEKAYARIMANAEAEGPMQYGLFKRALEVGRKVSELKRAGKQPRGLLRVRYSLADRLVFSKVREQFGGQLRFFISGAAPLPTEIAEFFHAAGILILEGYGLTESSAASCMNVPESFVFGTVGRPLPGTSVRVDETGEILLRGRGLMSGYHKLPEESEETLVHDDQGRIWLRTGDVGEILPSGHVRITDRKKEIIITSAGKNIAPAHFRNLLKAHSRFISYGLLHGDRRPWCVALLTLNEAETSVWAREHGLSWRNLEELTLLPEVRALVQRDIDAINAELADHAVVRRFALLPEDFTVENGLLTPSLKIKRQAVEERYGQILEGLYA